MQQIENLPLPANTRIFAVSWDTWILPFAPDLRLMNMDVSHEQISPKGMLNYLRFHSSSSIHRFSEELETGSVTAEDTCCNRSGMEAYSHFKLSRVGSKNSFKLARHIAHLCQTFTGESSHDDCMIGLRVWQSGDGHITVAHSLDLEHLPTLSDFIECIIDGLEQLEDLRWITSRRPRCETYASIS